MEHRPYSMTSTFYWIEGFIWISSSLWFLFFLHFFFFFYHLWQKIACERNCTWLLWWTHQESWETWLAGLQIVLAVVTHNRPLWGRGLFLCGALFLTALVTSISHFCLGTAVFCFLPITLLELKKKNRRNTVSQRLLWLELLSGILKSRQWRSKLELEKFQNKKGFFIGEASKLLGWCFLSLLKCHV